MKKPKKRKAPKAPKAPPRHPREGWEEEFRRMAEAGDDEPLLPDDMANEWDETEWRW